MKHQNLLQEFRQTPQGNHVALTYPQILLRIPYGEKHEEVDCFAFEEFSLSSALSPKDNSENHYQHNQLLWGNSAFACARLLIRQYQAQAQAPFDTHITELPAFVYEQEGEPKLHACGEYLLSEKQLMHIQMLGVNVFASFRNKKLCPFV